MKVLTISIAAYNVEKYLENTLKSICDSPAIDDVEVIVVDDGSKDKTGEIGDRFAQLFPQSVRNISKPNGGHGSTINVGLAEATGKYFRVLDGDDWFDTEGFTNYVTKLKNVDTDLVISNKKLAFPDHEEKIDFNFLKENQIYNVSNQYTFEICTLSTMTIKTDILKQNTIKITENSFYVDLEYVVYCMLLSATFCYIDENVYMYRRGLDEQSINKKSMIKNINMLERVTYGLFSIMHNYTGIEAARDFAYQRIEHATGALYRIYFLLDNYNESKERIKQFENNLRTHYKNEFLRIEEDHFIKMLRLMNYSFLPAMRIAYRANCKKQGQI